MTKRILSLNPVSTYKRITESLKLRLKKIILGVILALLEAHGGDFILKVDEELYQNLVVNSIFRGWFEKSDVGKV